MPQGETWRELSKVRYVHALTFCTNEPGIEAGGIAEVNRLPRTCKTLELIPLHCRINYLLIRQGLFSPCHYIVFENTALIDMRYPMLQTRLVSNAAPLEYLHFLCLEVAAARWHPHVKEDTDEVVGKPVRTLG